MGIRKKMDAVVKYQVADYKGKVDVFGIDEDDDNEYIIALAKKQIFKHGAPAPMYYEHYEVIRSNE